MQIRPNSNILSDEQKLKIHECVTTVLSETGVIIDEPSAREVLYSAGAQVDGTRVRIPADVLDKALGCAPNSIKVFDREGNPAMDLGTNSVYFGVHADTPEIFDFDTGDLRRYRLEDAGKVARLCDALPNISFISQNGFAEDVHNPSVVTALAFAQMMRNSSKPLGVGCYDSNELKLVLEVAATVREDMVDLGRRPFFYHYSEPTSPLTHSAPSLRRLRMAVEHGIPLVYTPMVMAGATGPATLAGVVVQALADSLPGIVLAQTIRAGAPCIIGGVPTIMDMSTTICSYGAPEMSLMSMALTEMAKFYRLPMFGTGGCSDAPVVDPQFTAECAFSCLASALSGAHLIHDVGFLYHAERVGAESLVLADEIVGMVQSFMDGMRFDDEALAVDLIAKVGPMGNHLAEDHTMQNFRRYWRPGVFDRSMMISPSDGDSLSSRAIERSRYLLATHEPRSLSPSEDSELAKLEAYMHNMS